MKLSLKWLRDYVDITLPPEVLAHRLTLSGTEVGGINRIGAEWEGIRTARITALEKHPNADRLALATVDLGGETATVVTGAPNVRVGQVVPYAPVGARLIDGHSAERRWITLKLAKIRGITSRGMICSEKELGISEEHEGILVLPEDAPVGVPLADYLGDVILDLDLTPNRPDCLAVLGVAREVAAIEGTVVRVPDLGYPEEGPPVESLAAVEIADADLCPRYCASVIENVRIGPSPRWMQDRLLAAGMRPINNIVDITNYVMLEYGQPLHAFDYDRLRGHRIVVRRARPGEVMRTLDGQDRALAPEMLMIADAERAVAIAGVMGGEDSEVGPETRTILLESATFAQTSIRLTSRALRLRTEASARFDKGLSPELPPHGLRRATQLMVQLAGGRAARGFLDVYPGRVERAPLPFSTAEVRRVLGVDWSLDLVRGRLEALGFACRPAGPDGLAVTPPYWRTDIRLTEDLVEEVARSVGYDELPATMLRGEIPMAAPDPLRETEERVRDILVGCGLQEIITYSLVGDADLARVQLEGQADWPEPLRLINPMTPEQEVLRTTLRASMLGTLASNARHGATELRLFELGRVYLPREGDLPDEQPTLAIGLAGRGERTWLGGGAPVDFYDLKGIIEALLARLNLAATYAPLAEPGFHPGKTARIAIDGRDAGLLGEVHPRILERYDLNLGPVYYAELRVDALTGGALRQYRPISRYPAVQQDLAVVVDRDLPAERVAALIHEAALVRQAVLFDVYTGAPLPANKKSLAYRITYQAPDRTLTDREVNQAQARIVQRLARELGAEPRS